MNNWKETILDSVAGIIKNPWKPGDDFSKYIGLEHINENSLTLNGIGNSEELKSSKFKFRNGDILFGKLRPYFRKVITPNFDGICSTDIWVIRAREGFDQKYLFYFVANPVFIDKSMGANTGTHMPRADWNFLKNTQWKFPPIEEQKQIASVLSSLDDKIELLRSENETLEKIAQGIFKEWFVNFKIDGKKLKLKNGVPEGWRMGKMGEVTKICGGTTPDTKNLAYWNGDINWTSPKDLSDCREIFLTKTKSKITKEGLAKISSGLLPVKTLLLSSRAPIGYLAITNIPVAINQGYIAFLSGEFFSNEYIYLWLKMNMDKVISSANGSTFLEISKTSFRNIDIVVPKKEVFDNFQIVIDPIFDKILNNINQIRNLSKLRDMLLPKLMSGEVKVNV